MKKVFSPYVNRELEEQFKIIFAISEKHSPELCIKLMSESDMEELHHIIWDMPYFGKIYHVKQSTHFFKTIDEYYKVVDGLSYSYELMKIKKWKVTKKLFGDEQVEEDVISLRKDDRFERYFDIVMSMKPLEKLPDTIPNSLKNLMLFGRF